MRRVITSLALTAAAAFLLAACGSSSSSSSSSGAPATGGSGSTGATMLVHTASNAKLGTILVDAHGLTLYALSAESPSKLICTGSCLNAWHPLTVAAGASPTGTVSPLGTVHRAGGIVQVTYRGKLLYTFAQDHAPGQVNGQGFKDVGTWSAVTTGGPASSANGSGGATSSGGSSSGGGRSGSGY